MDIIQFPKNFNIEDLPDNIEVNVPFKINNCDYIMIESNKKEIKICKKIDDEKTSKLEDTKKFYIIQKLI